MNEMCSYYGEKTETKVSGPDFRCEGTVAQRVKCPECGRKVKQKITHCGCGFECACEYTISLPKHKVKGWWKKKGRQKPG